MRPGERGQLRESWPRAPIGTAVGLQALGLRPGDTVAGLLPNGTDALARFCAAAQTGLYVVPVNWHLTALEVAYILADSGARAFAAHERFGTAVAIDAADAAGIDPGSRYAAGQVPGFAPLAARSARTARGFPDPRTAGAPDDVHLGHLEGGPQGRAPPADRRGPGQSVTHRRVVLRPFSSRRSMITYTKKAARRSTTAVLNFATISLQLGHPVVLMDHFEPEELLALVDRHRVTHTHMVPTSSASCSRCRSRCATGTTCPRCAPMIHSAAPCPPDVKRAHDPVVRPESSTEYHAADRGAAGPRITARRLARPPRQRSGTPAARAPRSRVLVRPRPRRPAAGQTAAGLPAHGHLRPFDLPPAIQHKTSGFAQARRRRCS